MSTLNCRGKKKEERKKEKQKMEGAVTEQDAFEIQ
jgi:hypothetical protein